MQTCLLLAKRLPAGALTAPLPLLPSLSRVALENSTQDTAPPTSHQTPPHNTGPSSFPFSLSPTFGRAAPYPWFFGGSHPGQWSPGARPAHCLSDHAPSPTPFSLSPAFGPAALQHWVLELSLFCQCRLRDEALPTAQGPPTTSPGPASPAHFRDSPPTTA